MLREWRQLHEGNHDMAAVGVIAAYGAKKYETSPLGDEVLRTHSNPPALKDPCKSAAFRQEDSRKPSEGNRKREQHWATLPLGAVSPS